LKGYRSRNIQIAECCDILYDIELKGSCKHCGGKGLLEFRNHETCNYCKGTGNYSGGTWTYRKALEFGKEAHQIIIDR
jgi:DnaJ-class molecular chaperone